MALFYKAVQRYTQPGDPTSPKKWYVILKSLGMKKEKDVAKAISDETTLNPKEAEMAIYQYQKVLLNFLLDGHTVQMGELGTFQLTVKSEGVENESDISASQVQKINIRFSPSASLKESISKATLKPTKDLM